MIIGVDFDNTIVCYDGLFHALAVEQGLVPANVQPAKNAVRDYLRIIGQEDRWTELQGYVYGPGMRRARLFPGVVEFFDRRRREGVEVFIISHRTRYPFLGERHDLHQAARDFLAEHGFNDPARIGMPVDHIYFFETKAEKIAQINAAGCTHFVDDLPEILTGAEMNESVERILFDPNDQHEDCANMRRVRSWAEVEAEVGWVELARPTRTTAGAMVGLASSTHPTINQPPSDIITALLETAGLPGNFEVAPLPGGGNNRVYRVDCEGRPLLLKAYFHHPDDPRNRLDAEFTFLRFAWDGGIRSIAQPLARDDGNHLGLYEYIEGRVLNAHEIGAAEVDQAAAFFVALNRRKSEPAAKLLRAASEACFTLAEHHACVDRRVERLKQIDESSPLDCEAAGWVRDNLVPQWNRMQAVGLRYAQLHGLAWDERLADDDCCLSPSDFGFHNAILPPDGRLRFVDFEYAGWDDPAKTVCDFFSQPKLPVPDEFATRFSSAVIADSAGSESLSQRIALLLPVYRLKWCCIMMNEFLPVGDRRRSFAQDAGDQEERKRVQLEKAQRALDSIGA